MASPPGVQRAAASSRGCALALPRRDQLPLPRGRPVPPAAPPSRTLRRRRRRGGGRRGIDDDDEEEACSSQQRCASSPGEERVCAVASALIDSAASRNRMIRVDLCKSKIILGIGHAVMNGQNVVRQIQEEQLWQHSHMYNRGTEQYGHASSRGDEPGTIPREMRVDNGYGIIGRREGGPASSYCDLLRAHL